MSIFPSSPLSCMAQGCHPDFRHYCSMLVFLTHRFDFSPKGSYSYLLEVVSFMSLRISMMATWKYLSANFNTWAIMGIRLFWNFHPCFAVAVAVPNPALCQVRHIAVLLPTFWHWACPQVRAHQRKKPVPSSVYFLPAFVSQGTSWLHTVDSYQWWEGQSSRYPASLAKARPKFQF